MKTDEAKIKTELRQIQTRITEEFSGIIWLTESPLNKNLPYYYALDYLTDGAYSQLVEKSKTPSANLVMTKSFGHNFFVAQFCTNEEKRKILNTHSILTEEETKKASKILLLGNISLEIEEELKRNSPYLTFEILAS